MIGSKPLERRIRVSVVENRTTRLLVATSRDLPGLIVAARTEEQIARELPGAIRELLEAEGITVLSVETEANPGVPESFIDHSLIANAVIETARV